MKEFESSIKKTIKSIKENKLSEEMIHESLGFHENQWIAQEELWNTSKTNRCVKLWNELVSLEASYE